MKNYWLRAQHHPAKGEEGESEEEHLTRRFAEIDRWEQRYSAFDFCTATWDPRALLAVIRASKRPAPELWRAHGITHQYLALGVPFGEARSTIAYLSIPTHRGALPSPLFVKDIHPELLAHLEGYSSSELHQLTRFAQCRYDNPQEPCPPAPSGHQPITWRIPQRTIPGEEPVCLATISTEPATIDRYDAIRALVSQLGPKGILIDLREAPDTHKELARRQRLQRNTFTWPGDQAARALHPIGLRDTFGMRYRKLSPIDHFARRPAWASQYPDTALEHRTQVWMHKPERCAPVLDLLQQRHPILLVDACPTYEFSLRRTIVVHLLSLFSTQLEILPEQDVA